MVVLGEHLDHQLGPVLAAPVEEGVACAWGMRPDPRVVVWGMNARQKDSFSLERVFRTGRSWSDLARGAYAHVAQGRGRMPGIDLLVMGDLPIGEGLASSAAYLVVLLRCLYEAVGVYRSKWELAEDVPAIERAWRGVDCGPMDPYVVAAARPGQVLRVDCRELDHDTLELPAGCTLSTEDTGIRRTLDQTPYNQRRAELATAWEEVRALRPGLRGLCDLPADEFLALQGRLTETSRRRARHVVTETARVHAATDAIEDGDAETLGRLMVEGHRSLSCDFESSLPQIDTLVDLLVARPGVLGVRLQGAGWGGRLVVLRRAEAA
jgi:galactokinase